ncbi:MAG TPA: hypothetical protein VHT34_07230 [Clostridia bacterium]|nr:hypothetical protein [Clostridia bacterium]
MRKDLLTISEADLEVFTNRGTVKRAVRDLDEALFIGTLNETDDGLVEVLWSDGAVCRFPPDVLIKDGRCTCPSTSMCRHLVRTVLFYQRFHAEAAIDGETGTLSEWDPGDISDADIEALVSPNHLVKAKKLFSEGLLVECIRSSKPYAVIHGLGIMVRFPVHGDFRYAHADCEGNMGAIGSAIAVWAFRLLDKDKESGFVVTAQSAGISSEAFDSGKMNIYEVMNFGFASLPPRFEERFRSAEGYLREANLTWPADIMADLALEFRRYTDHDSLFSPQRCIEYAGEFLLRADCLASPQHSIPLALVGGTRYDAPLELNTRRFTGLGSGVRILAKSVVVQMFLEDVDSGSIVVVEKEFSTPENGPARDFRFLGETPVAAGAKLIDIARSQLLAGSSKRTASGILSFGRKLVVNPQAFNWEKFRENNFHIDYAELHNRIAFQPPSALRARRVAESFQVIGITGVEYTRFDPVTLEVRCEFFDSQGVKISMVHPYLSQAASGCELLLDSLSQENVRPVFAAGHIRITSAGLTIFPASVVVEKDGRRTMIQPWLDSPHGMQAGETAAIHEELPVRDSIERWFVSLESVLSELLQMGIRKADSQTVALWKQIANDAGAIGFVRIARQVELIAEALDKTLHNINEREDGVCDLILDMLRLLRLARDLF